jgi:hypothetical protein
MFHLSPIHVFAFQDAYMTVGVPIFATCSSSNMVTKPVPIDRVQVTFLSFEIGHKTACLIICTDSAPLVLL